MLLAHPGDFLMDGKSECNATGGGRFKQLAFTPLEEDIANLLQFGEHINPEGIVQGVQIQANNVEASVSDGYLEEGMANGFELDTIDAPINQELPGTSSQNNLDSMPSSSNHQQPYCTTKRKKTSSTSKTLYLVFDARNELLEKHSDKQIKLLTDISNTLSSENTVSEI